MRQSVLTSVVALGLGAISWALPQDPSTAHGQVQIQMVNPNLMQILQSSPQAILNWNQFNIGLGETVRFLQPSTQAAILNRVTGTDPSLIQGMLQANGQVFLLNPNGILFGPSAVVDVGSFMASTLKMSDDDFLSGTYRLTQDRSLPLAALTNQGQIHVADGGFVVLTSPLLDNQGLIVAQSGSVNLGATTQATFSVDGRGQVQFAMPDGFNSHFTGGGQGGTVLLQPGQVSSILSQVVNNPGLVEAGSFSPGANGQTLAHGAEGVLLNSGTVQADGGSVRLDSSQATVLTSAGVVSARNGDARVLSDGSTLSLGAVNAQGGFVEISAEHLGLYGPVSATTVLLDPNFIQIINAASGGGTRDSDILLGNPPAADGTVSTGALVSVTNALLQADLDISYIHSTGPELVGPGTTLSLIAGRDIIFSLGGANIELAALSMQANNNINITNAGQIKTDSGPISMTATTGDIVLTSSGTLSLASTQTILLDAGRDVSINVPSGFAMDEASTGMTITAGRDFSLVSDFLGQSASNNLNINAVQNVDIRSNPSDILNYNVGGLSVTAGGTLTAHADGGFAIGTNPGDLSLVSGGALSLDSSNSNLALSSLGTTTLQGSTVTVSANGALNMQGHNGLSLTSTNGNLHVNSASGGGLVSAAGPVSLQSTGGDIFYSSPFGLDLRGAGPTNVNSSNNLTIQTGVGHTLALDGTPTTLHADHDVDIRTTSITGGSHPISITAGDNVTFTPGTSSNLDFSQTQSLNVNAANDLVVSVPGTFLITTTGDQTLTAGRNLTVTSGSQQAFNANGGSIRWQGGAVNDTSGSSQDWRGDGITIVSTGTGGSNGNVTLVNNGSGGDISLNSVNANVNVTSAHDLTIAAPSQVSLKSSTSTGITTVNASHDLQINTGNAQLLTLGGTSAQLQSGHDMTLTSDFIRGDGAASTALNLQSGHDLRLRNFGGTNGLDVQSTSVNATAVNDLLVDGGPSLVLAGTDGDLRLQGDRNLSLSTTGNLQISSSGALHLQGGNVTSNDGSGTLLQGGTSSSITATSGNVNLHTNGNNLHINTVAGPTTITAAGNVILVEPQNLVIGGTPVIVQATNGNVDLGTGAGAAFTPGGPMLVSAGGNVTYTGSNLSSFSAVNLRTTSGNVTLQSLPAGGLSVSTAGLNVTAGNDLLAHSDAGDVNLGSSSGTNVSLSAGRNVTVTAPNGAVNIGANAGNVSLTGQNVTVQALNSSSIKSALGTGTTVNISATAGNVDLQVSGSGSDFSIGADGGTTLSATGVLAIRSAGTGTSLRAPNGNVTLSGGQGIDMSGAVLTISGRGARLLSNSGTTFAPGSVATATSAGVDGNSSQDLDLTNLRLNVAGGNVTLNANRNLKVGEVLFPSSANATLTGGNVTIHSMQDLQSGNVTITTPGNLTETVAATSPSTLAGLNITAGQIHNLNNTADNVSFSIPNTVNPANLNVTITGGNDTLVPSAANLRNFNGANVQPVSIPNQTGDVYVDGVLRTAGLPPLVPPPPPPPIPSSPVLQPEQLVGLTGDERAQILAQSNLALGNLGSFSRVLSDTEREHFTTRMDSLHYTWNQDPFSPTLALVLPGGPPLVSARELSELESMLGLDVGAAVNTMLAQELGYIWEVRYWRHLTEGLIIWEDRE